MTRGDFQTPSGFSFSEEYLSGRRFKRAETHREADFLIRK